MHYWELAKEDQRALRPEDFMLTREFTTRWRDNDAWGHLNNAAYYEYFDNAINDWFLEQLGPTLSHDATLQFVAESACRYFRETAYPRPLIVGVRVARLGHSSITFELGLFDAPDGVVGDICALGRWVQVFVDGETRTPVSVPEPVRTMIAAAS